MYEIQFLLTMSFRKKVSNKISMTTVFTIVTLTRMTVLFLFHVDYCLFASDNESTIYKISKVANKNESFERYRWQFHDKSTKIHFWSWRRKICKVSIDVRILQSKTKRSLITTILENCNLATMSRPEVAELQHRFSPKRMKIHLPPISTKPSKQQEWHRKFQDTGLVIAQPCDYKFNNEYLCQWRCNYMVLLQKTRQHHLAIYRVRICRSHRSCQWAHLGESKF